MAHKVETICDVCRKPTKKVVGKLFYSPKIPGVHRGKHSLYTHHLDVGVCCKGKLFKLLNFSPRMTRQEYEESRRNGGG